jgi:hypothetical protein
MSSAIRDKGQINQPITRPTSWWLSALRRRAETVYDHQPDFSGPIELSSDAEREACISFFNAAYRAEESGERQALRLADDVRAWDPPLAETLVLYGREEGWHRELLSEFIPRLGGSIRPMGLVDGVFYRLYGLAREMETIMLVNLMFETIGATTYRLALRRVRQPALRAMLLVLMRDESFHIPLNVHFIRQILAAKPPSQARRLKLRAVYQTVFAALVGSAFASRRVAGAFDHITFAELATAYAENLGQLFLHERDLGFTPPWLLLRLFGLGRRELAERDLRWTSVTAAEAAADRDNVQIQIA